MPLPIPDFHLSPVTARTVSQSKLPKYAGRPPCSDYPGYRYIDNEAQANLLMTPTTCGHVCPGIELIRPPTSAGLNVEIGAERWHRAASSPGRQPLPLTSPADLEGVAARARAQREPVTGAI